jgi:hypothetical protein
LKSTEVIFEAQDNSVNQIAEFNQRWVDRLSLDNPRLAERYIKAELLIVLKVNLRVGNVNKSLVSFCKGKIGSLGKSKMFRPGVWEKVRLPSLPVKILVIP